jgi:hypothetical protein
MTKITRRAFLGLVKYLPLVPLAAKLPPAPAVEQAAETASAEGGFLVPAEYTAEIFRQFKAPATSVEVAWPSYSIPFSQELLDDNVAWDKLIESAFEEQMQQWAQAEIAALDDTPGPAGQSPIGLVR